MSLNVLSITEMKITNLKDSIYVKPLSIEYKQNGKQRRWDCNQVHDGVAVIIFNTTREVLVIVKQFRPAVYYCSIPEDEKKIGKTIDTNKYPLSLGITYEFCSGCVDKKKSLAEIAAEEVLEECGYSVTADKMVHIKSHRESVGTEGGLQTLFYVEVTDSMKVSEGGGLADEGEVIEVVEMNIQEVKEYLDNKDNICPAGFLYGLQWFLTKK